MGIESGHGSHRALPLENGGVCEKIRFTRRIDCGYISNRSEPTFIFPQAMGLIFSRPRRNSERSIISSRHFIANAGVD
jgi:hypothetical protein